MKKIATSSLIISILAFIVGWGTYIYLYLKAMDQELPKDLTSYVNVMVAAGAIWVIFGLVYSIASASVEAKKDAAIRKEYGFDEEDDDDND